MSRLFQIGVVVFLSCQALFAIEGAEIGIYNGEGTWYDGIISFEQFLDWKGITHERFGPLDVNLNDLTNYYEGIYFPGGDAYYYKRAINETGLQHIRALVQEGGAYIGMCAGAYFASDSVDWEGEIYDYQLDLFQGTATGAIAEIAPWPDYAMTVIDLNPDNPINRYEPPSQTTLYYGGPVFQPHENTIIDTVATWHEYHNDAAIINFSYGNGRVLLVGPHPEIEEDSDRDSTDFAQELDDDGTEWNLLWTAVDWVLGRSISQPPGIGILGDVNNDDSANSTDALIILSCDVGIDVSQFCPMNCGDVNEDGLVNSTDALIVLSADVGMSTPYPVGSNGCPESVTPCAGCSVN